MEYVSGCSKSTIKVRRKYPVSKVQVQLKYGKSTAKYGKSIVLYGNFFLVPTVCMFFFYSIYFCRNSFYHLRIPHSHIVLYHLGTSIYNINHLESV